MLNRIKNVVDDYLLAPQFRRDQFVVKKARLLGWIHIIALVCGLCMLGGAFIVHDPMLLPLVAFNLLVVGLLYAFRRIGNLVLSGNLLVGMVAVVLLSSMLDTGGLYSDNLMWMVLVPIVAFLFTDKTWGLVWSGLAIATLVSLYALEVNADTSYRYRSLDLDADYYLVSYLGLFSGLFGIILLFVRGNDDILRSLRRKSAALRKQKHQVVRKNALLRQKETELKQSNRDLELFAYVASHDLKEPLRMINAYTQILQRNLAPTLDDKQLEYMGFVRDGAQRMQTMLDDLLAFSRIGKERSGVKPVELEHALLIVRNNLKVRLDESGGEILSGPLPLVYGKATHLVQVFQNLIANSLKFRREDVAPRVRVTSRIDDHSPEFVLAVEDNGIGIREEDIESIFGVFQRLHTKEKYEGSGIGLATVQRVIQGMGGRIEVSSKLGEGTVFSIYLPKSCLNPPAEETEHTEQEALRRAEQLQAEQA